MSDSEPVHFFDIKSSLEGSSQSWSPNTVKIRILLNHRLIPYTQDWVLLSSLFCELLPSLEGQTRELPISEFKRLWDASEEWVEGQGEEWMREENRKALE
ncbi:hypothetical protein BDY24DRAFT_379933 [Mrakia frigida]|uniref:uncharacterized protein n=1 Tax=Mrakia frigida TaxID=29902 RepID=UPI003FCC038D